MSSIPGTGGLLVYDQTSEFASSHLATLPGMEQVPKGMNYHPIVVFSGGKPSKVVGYVQATGRIAPTDPAGNQDDSTIDPVGEATVFFASADKSQVNKWAKKFGLQDSGQKDASNGSSLFTAIPKPTAQSSSGTSPNPSTGAAPAAGQDPAAAGAAAAAGGPGSYGATGSSTAVGNLNTAPNLGAARDASSVDTSQLMVTVNNPDTSKLSPDEIGRINALGGGVQPQQSSIQAQVDAVFGLTPAQQADLYKKLAAAGYKPSGTGLYDLAKSYEGALLDLNQLETRSPGDNRFLSVDQFLAQQAQAQKTGQATTQSRTDTTINLTDPNQARGLVQSAIASALGRNPTADEISQFTASLQAAEKASPNVTSTTATTSPDGTSTSQSSTSSGGFSSPDAYAQQWVEQNMPGQVHAAQIGTSLFNIIASAMNGNTS